MEGIYLSATPTRDMHTVADPAAVRVGDWLRLGAGCCRVRAIRPTPYPGVYFASVGPLRRGAPEGANVWETGGEKMDEREEAAYTRGVQMAWRMVLNHAMRQLNTDDAKIAAWVEERAATIALLRQLCETHGDNDWPDTLYVPDIIEKHLARHLED